MRTFAGDGHASSEVRVTSIRYASIVIREHTPVCRSELASRVTSPGRVARFM